MTLTRTKPTHPINNFSRCLLIGVTALLTACGSSGGGAAPNDIETAKVQVPANTVSRMGSIVLGSVSGPSADQLGISNTIVHGYAEFVDYGQVITQAYIDERLSFTGDDSCEYTIDSSDDSKDVGLESPAHIKALESNLRLLNAGDTLGITTAAGTWAEMQLFNDFGAYYEFQTDVHSLGELPQGSTLSIPGQEFPGFASMTIPHVEPITDSNVSNLNNRVLSAETTFNWTKPIQPDSSDLIALSLSFYGSDLESDTEVEVQINCRLADDGEFTPSNDMKQLLAQYPFEMNDVYLSRFGIATEVNGNAAVQIIRYSTYSF